MAGSRIPRIETLIIGIFFLSVSIWAINKCTSKRLEVVNRIQQFAANDEDERPVKPDSIPAKPSNAPAATAATQKPPATPESASPANTTTAQPVATKPAAPAATAQNPVAANSGTTLYVTIDGLKVHQEPGLKGATIAQLKLYEPVTFLNKKTDWTQEISLGYEKVTDHWIKIRTKSGKEGWVFGAGVHYYKMKRKGVME